jgi:hypothetical protein
MRRSARLRLQTLESWLAVVTPHLPPDLVDEQAREHLEAAGRYLPTDCLGIVEVHLAADKTEVDLSLRLTYPDQARYLASQLCQSHLHKLLCRWAGRQQDREHAPSLWLEFDLDQDRDDLPPPLLCAQLTPKTDPLWLADTLLPALHGQPLAPDQRNLVLLCAREIPPPARLLYAFSLLPRPGEAVRLEILGLGPNEAHAYLSRVAPHTLPTLAEIAPLLVGTENPHLSFDITSEILPRIGLEGAFPRQPKREPRWGEVLGRLVEQGLCAPEKRDAVLAWPGQDSFWTAPERWPVEAVGVGGVLVRFLSHLKVVGEPGRPPQVKAYLGFEHRSRAHS